MRAVLVSYQKARALNRFIVELVVYQVQVSERYSFGFKYHPKGPHVHIDDHEFEYSFSDLLMLQTDFRNLIEKRFGVQI
jgi:hypothetical protein